MPIIKTDKETILKDSIALLKLHGYHNTTMAKIGEACGLIKGSVLLIIFGAYCIFLFGFVNII